MKKVFIAFIAVSIPAIAFLAACAHNYVHSFNSSYTANESFVVSDGQYLFFGSYHNDINNIGCSLMRSNINGEEQIELANHRYMPQCICVRDDWVYYKMFCDIYRVKIDGSEHQTIVNGDSMVKHMNIAGEWIYFMTEKSIYADGGEPIGFECFIWKVMVDGTQKQLVIDDGRMFLTVYGSDIYYLSQSPNSVDYGITLCKVSVDGGEKKVLLSDEPNISVMIIYGDTIYCGRHWKRSNAVNAFSVDLNGQNKKELNFSATSMFIYDGKIYYHFYPREVVAELYQYDISTGEKTKVISLTEEIVGERSASGASFRRLTVVNDYIYFSAAIDKTVNGRNRAWSGVFRSDLTGNDLVLLSQGQ